MGKYLPWIWALATEVFGDKEKADVMVHDFIGYTLFTDSLKDLNELQYQSVIQWLEWCKERMQVLSTRSSE